MMREYFTEQEAWIRDFGWRLKQKSWQQLKGNRMYAAAKQSRLTMGFGNSTTSADSELSTSLPTLRARSRQLIRDAAYAKRAKVIVVNNVVGPGI
jgi:predicted nucleic acid-binding Zn ribbon protein